MTWHVRKHATRIWRHVFLPTVIGFQCVYLCVCVCDKWKTWKNSKMQTTKCDSPEKGQETRSVDCLKVVQRVKIWWEEGKPKMQSDSFMACCVLRVTFVCVMHWNASFLSMHALQTVCHDELRNASSPAWILCALYGGCKWKPTLMCSCWVRCCWYLPEKMQFSLVKIKFEVVHWNLFKTHPFPLVKYSSST